jgi:hypothetical protein
VFHARLDVKLHKHDKRGAADAGTGGLRRTVECAGKLADALDWVFQVWLQAGSRQAR